MKNCLVVSACILLATLISASTLVGQNTERSFPYQAFVLGEKAAVYSGPGSVHYTTDELKQDSVVDVYRHDPGGWCAIKPPAGSFSLVPETAVEKLADNLGRIKEDGIQAWVGTRTGTVEKPLWQVKLREDETVAILGEVSWPNPEGHSTIWFQIAPPAGEFRWLRISDLKLPKHATDLPDLFGGTADRIQSSLSDREFSDDRTTLTSGNQELDPSFSDSLDPPSENNLAENHGWRRARTPVRVADKSNLVRNAEPFTTPAIEAASIAEPSVNRSAFESGNDSSAPQIDLATSDQLIGPMTGPVSERIRFLESALTTELLKSPADWNLEVILRQATEIATNSNLVQERQHAERLIKKVRTCTSIQSRFEIAYVQSGTIEKASATANSLLGLPNRNNTGGLTTPNANNVDGAVQLGTTYDAHGWLNQLVRSKGSLQPSFVLENDQGQITHHITPSPGLNLNRYLRSKVGVVGRRGFDRSLKLDHVTADRIVVLEQLRR